MWVQLQSSLSIHKPLSSINIFHKFCVTHVAFFLPPCSHSQKDSTSAGAEVLISFMRDHRWVSLLCSELSANPLHITWDCVLLLNGMNIQQKYIPYALFNINTFERWSVCVCIPLAITHFINTPMNMTAFYDVSIVDMNNIYIWCWLCHLKYLHLQICVLCISYGVTEPLYWSLMWGWMRSLDQQHLKYDSNMLVLDRCKVFLMLCFSNKMLIQLKTMGNFLFSVLLLSRSYFLYSNVEPEAIKRE